DPTVISSYDSLKMATINGAKALGVSDIVGSIEVGKCADLIILDMNNINSFPTVDLITNVVHNACFLCVDTTIIDGEVLYENKKLKLNIDEEELKNNINAIINRLNI